MNRIEKIKYLLSKKETRYELLKSDLYLFSIYYFTNIFKDYKSSDFQKEWCKDLLTNKNILIKAFRESAKTTFAIIKIIHTIVYDQKRFIMFYCYDKAKATSRLYDIILHLQTNERLKGDFWELFWWVKKDDTKEKKSIPEFITVNHIKVKANSIWESPRWLMYSNKQWNFRPDLVVLDDIDVDKSVSNIEMIDKNYLWIKGELLGWISWDCQIIFLWNTIKSDWIVPRFENDYKNSDEWIIRSKAIIENWEITWASRFTQEDLNKRRAMLWEISYNQNYLLIPFSWWDTIIKRERIKYYDYDLDFENIVISVDPAISEKTKSDSFAIIVIWKYNNCFYIIESFELIEKQKDPFNATIIIKELYYKYKANYILIETVAFQQVMSKLFKNEWLATKETKPHKDKITRVLEKQYLFEQWKIFFKSNWNEKLVNQLLDFPNVLHDDLCLVWETQITTIFWNKNLKDLKIGDYVLTPFWFRKVINSKCTWETKVITATFWNKSITWTSKHKVFFYNKTFWFLEDFKYNTSVSILNFKELFLWKLKKLLFLNERHINLCDEKESIIFLNQNQINEENELKDYMLLYGKAIIKKKFQKVILFIIKTITLLIIILITLIWLKILNIVRNIWKKDLKIKNIVKNKWSIYEKLEIWQRNGIEVKNEKNGTKNIIKIVYEKLKKINIFVFFVKKNMKAQEQKKQNIVLENADMNLIKLKKNAYYVEKDLKQQKNKIEKLAVENVVQYTDIRKVYNITIEWIHCYYANWILVWNCDSLTQWLEIKEKKKFIFESL